MLTVAILAGGLGTRLSPVTERVPKALVPVAGRPFIHHLLTSLRSRGIERVVLCVGHLGELVEHYVGDGSGWGLSVAYSYDGPRLAGTAGALRQALSLLGPSFFVTYGDSFLTCDYAGVQRSHERSGKAATMVVYRNANRIIPSNVEFADGLIKAYDKTLRSPHLEYVDYGLSVFARETIAAVPEGISVDLTDVVSRLIATDQLAGYEVHERFYEIGTPDGIAQTTAFIEGLGATGG